MLNIKNRFLALLSKGVGRDEMDRKDYVGKKDEYNTCINFQCDPYGSFNIKVGLIADDVDTLTAEQFAVFDYIQSNWDSIWLNLIPIFEELSNEFAYIKKKFVEHLKSGENYFEITIPDYDPPWSDGNWSISYNIKMPSSGYCSMDVILMDDQVKVFQPCY
jgi:hypothetical protein